jgi:hypothetical protein
MIFPGRSRFERKRSRRRVPLARRAEGNTAPAVAEGAVSGLGQSSVTALHAGARYRPRGSASAAGEIAVFYAADLPLTFVEFIPILPQPSKEDFSMAYPPNPPFPPSSPGPDFGTPARRRISGLLGPYLEAKAGIAPRGLLDLDPNWPPDAEIWAQTAASVNPSLLPDFSALSAALQLQRENGAGPFSGTLSANAPPGPTPAAPASEPTAEPNRYLEGGLGAGANWQDQFTASGFDRTRSWLDGAASALDPQRGQPFFNAPPAGTPGLPELGSPDFLFPEMLQLAPTGNSEGTDPYDLEPARSSDRIFRAIWPHIATWEGGYSNDPSDPGGETMHGISRRFIRNHNLDIGNIRAITEEQAHNIVKKHIYYGRNIDLLPPELQPQVLDASLPAEYGGI